MGVGPIKNLSSKFFLIWDQNLITLFLKRSPSPVLQHEYFSIIDVQGLELFIVNMVILGASPELLLGGWIPFDLLPHFLQYLVLLLGYLYPLHIHLDIMNVLDSPNKFANPLFLFLCGLIHMRG